MSELINASRRNVIVTARRLLDDGADPNIQDNRGNTALIWASLNISHSQFHKWAAL